MSGFDVLSPAQQQQIISQYGSLAAARAAMEAPAPPPVGAPVAPSQAAPQAPPPKPIDDVNAGPVTPEEAARYGASPKEVALSAAGPSNPDETWEQKQARLKSYGPTPDAKPAAPPMGPAATAAGAPAIKFSSPAPGSATPAPTPGINWGSAGGGGVVPAHEQKLTTKAREDELLGGIDQEAAALEAQKTAVGGSAEANAEVKRQEAIGLHDIAKATEDAGVDMKLRAQQHADESKAYRQHIENYAAKLATDKIDPNRMWHNADAPHKIAWTIASALGALAQSDLHLSTNQAADRIEAMAAQDVAAQRANHEIGREHLADMRTMYGEALRETGNTEEAERVATGYALESAKQQAQALTASAQSKTLEQKGKELEAIFDERIAQLGQRKAETGMKLNPLVQAHAGGGVDMNKVYASAREYVKEQAALGTVVQPDEAIRWAYKMHTGTDPLRNAGSFAGGAKGDPANKELRETQTATDEFNRQIDGLAKHPVITGSGLGTAIGAQLPQRVAPESNDAQQQLNAINTRNLQAIGKVAKDADGKPNKEMIKKIEERFEIHLGDTPEMKQQKLQGVREVYNALARQQGAKAPEPSKGPPPGMVP